jgi:hypothetical protein
VRKNICEVLVAGFNGKQYLAKLCWVSSH